MKILLSVSTGFLAHTLAPVTPLLAMAGAASEVADLWRLKSASCHSFSLAPKNEEMSEFCWFFRLSQSMKNVANAASCAIVRLYTKFEYNGKLYCWMAHSNTTQMSHPQKYASQTESSIFGEVPHFAHFFLKLRQWNYRLGGESEVS